MNLLECFLIGMRTKLMSLIKRLIEVLVLGAYIKQHCVCVCVSEEYVKQNLFDKLNYNKRYQKGEHCIALHAVLNVFCLAFA